MKGMTFPPLHAGHHDAAVSLACTAFEGGALTKQLVEVVRSLAAAAFHAQWQEANAVSLPAPGAAPSPAPVSPFDKPDSAVGEQSAPQGFMRPISVRLPESCKYSGGSGCATALHGSKNTRIHLTACRNLPRPYWN